MAAPRRLRIQIYADVLRAIHSTTKNGERLTPYRIEREAALTHTRLRRSLRELENVGLVDETGHVTPKGYGFLVDVTSKVAPTLRKYGLWNGHM